MIKTKQATSTISATNLYSGKFRYDFQKGHRLSWLKVFVAFLSTPRQMPGHNSFWLRSLKTTLAVVCTRESRPPMPKRRGVGVGRWESGTHYQGPGPDCVAHILLSFSVVSQFIMCRPHKLTLSDNAKATLQILRSRYRASLVNSSTTNKMQGCTMVFIAINALHVSCGSSAHHQELELYTTIITNV
jgi:hypothetical protein